ncbi:MAG: TRL-like family protein [Bdellovibrionota bacterium]
MQRIVYCLFVLLFVSGCATTGMMSSTGAAAISSFSEGVTATSAGQVSKVGRSCSQNILGIVSLGDSSIDAARRNGRISTIAIVDREILNILYLYGQSCTVVKGN